MHIVVDAMGSDTPPGPDVTGALLAAREFGLEITLVGDEKAIRAALAQNDTDELTLHVLHAPQTITNRDKPSQVTKLKPESSMHLGSQLVSAGQADAFVTAGNTGAMLAIATLQTMKRIPGIKRPALSSLVSLRGKTMILIDIGANADARPEWMVQFATMGAIYAQKALGLANPRVGLLSTGEEEGKGNAQIRETAELLRTTALNFVGNIEPHRFVGGEADVIVSDGFVGNIFIKTMEGFGSLLFDLVREEAQRDLRSKLGGGLLRPALRRVYKQVDPFEIGGAPLLGVNGVIIIGHGRTNAHGVKNAIRQAKIAIEGKLIEALHAHFAPAAQAESTPEL
ncbi:MAG: phosphate acyltransferase PlsX [Anaerolineae bacterium]|nr:phosphate acyltransferase PlsX [Anaerolineae bacterium]